ncbi:MAG: hypothetical protein RLZZ339_699, partial [Cyanobacteriota bacterium]
RAGVLFTLTLATERDGKPEGKKGQDGIIRVVVSPKKSIAIRAIVFLFGVSVLKKLALLNKV